MHDIVYFVVNGLLGGLFCALLHSASWSEVKSFTSIRAIILGAIAGYVFYVMHTEWSVPNGVMAFIFGYAAKDLVESLYQKIRLIGSRR